MIRCICHDANDPELRAIQARLTGRRHRFEESRVVITEEANDAGAANLTQLDGPLQHKT